DRPHRVCRVSGNFPACFRSSCLWRVLFNPQVRAKSKGQRAKRKRAKGETERAKKNHLWRRELNDECHGLDPWSLTLAAKAHELDAECHGLDPWSLTLAAKAHELDAECTGSPWRLTFVGRDFDFGQ